MDAKARFRDRGAALDECRACNEAAATDPGEKLRRSLEWSREWLAHYAQQLEDPGFRAAEDERALAKGELLAVWRRAHRGDR